MTTWDDEYQKSIPSYVKAAVHEREVCFFMHSTDLRSLQPVGNFADYQARLWAEAVSISNNNRDNRLVKE